MLFEDISIINSQFEVEAHKYVGVLEDKIVYIGDEKPQEDYGRCYDGTNKLLMPGFVNAHAHTPMTLMRGYSENKTLQDWLFNSIFPFEGKMTGEDVYNGMMLGIAEMLRFGIVSTTDMYFKLEDMCRAAFETGTKFNICNGTTAFDEKDFCENNAYRETEAVLKAYHGAKNGNILIDASIHAEYTSNPKVVTQVAEYAKEKGLRMQIHLSETKLEHEECIGRHGKTPTQYFADLGLLDVPVTAAHGVWLTKEDMQILAEKGATVAHNPVSNLKLASGVCNAPALLDFGVNLALGTDGMASNNNLNLLEEMKLFAILHKGVQYNPLLITPAQVLYAATRAGFLAQGRTDSGLLAQGYKADLIVMDMDKPYYYPVHNLLHNVIYAGQGTDICLTMVNGQVLYENGKYTTLDIEKVTYAACESTKRILGDL